MTSSGPKSNRITESMGNPIAFAAGARTALSEGLKARAYRKATGPGDGICAGSSGHYGRHEP